MILWSLQKFCASEPQPSGHSAWTAHLCRCCYLSAQRQTRYRNLGTCSQHMVITVPVCNLGYLMSVSPAIPSLFGTRDRLRGRLFFHRPGSGGWFEDDQALHIYYALYHYISCASDHQALDPGGWDPCVSQLLSLLLMFAWPHEEYLRFE